MSTSSTAGTITVSQTLDLLDGPYSQLAEGLANQGYALWLGSGISRGRVDDLFSVIRRVLNYLQSNSDFSNPDCKYHKALNEAIKLAQLSSSERSSINLAEPLSNWSILDTILERLRYSYANLLDIRIVGEPADYLLWNAVDVKGSFATSLEPDCEHICIAILAVEGFLKNIASANWDGLLESAFTLLIGDATNILRVCVRPDDFREPNYRARLMKFHGCAILAKDNEAVYRPLLVARKSQIEDWINDVDWAMMQQNLLNLATNERTLMIGLSAQDNNIRALFLKAKSIMPWDWPSNPPAYVFAEQELGQDQDTLLKCVYWNAYDANKQAIEDQSKIQAYAKPLLTAMVLYCLCAKFQILAKQAPSKYFPNTDFDTLGEGLRHLRGRVASNAEPDRLAFIKTFMQSFARAAMIFREGSLPNSSSAKYQPIGTLPISQITSSPDLVTSGLPELAIALSLVGLGDQSSIWEVTLSDPSKTDSGAISIKSFGGNQHKVYFAANMEAICHLYNGIIKSDDADTLIVCSTTVFERMARSPRAAPGRTGVIEPREVGIRSLLESSRNLAELQKLFREEAVL